MTAATVPHGVDRFVTTEARVLRVALLLFPLTIDRPVLVPGTPAPVASSDRRV
jgi:hypothetical protein